MGVCDDGREKVEVLAHENCRVILLLMKGINQWLQRIVVLRVLHLGCVSRCECLGLFGVVHYHRHAQSLGQRPAPWDPYWPSCGEGKSSALVNCSMGVPCCGQVI